MSLEQLRSTHEELEVYHQVLLNELSRHPRSKRQIVFQDHKLSHVGQSAHKRAKLLVELHEDKHKLLAGECKDLQNREQRFPKFYKELQDINKFHADNRELLAQSTSPSITPLATAGGGESTPSSEEQQHNDNFSELDIPESGDLLVDFSGEEYFGRYLDLHTFFARYKNLPGSKVDLSYESYVDQKFYDLTIFPPSTKSQRRYVSYVKDLFEYVGGFVQRTRPLSNHRTWAAQEMASFDVAWSKGSVLGWKNGTSDEIQGSNDDASQRKGAAESLEEYPSATQLETLGWASGTLSGVAGSCLGRSGAGRWRRIGRNGWSSALDGGKARLAGLERTR